MGAQNYDLSDDKKDEIQAFLIDRFKYLQELREPLDTEIIEEVKIYNNIDEDIEGKEEYESQQKVPYVYTIVQTMTARILSGLFGRKNYIKSFIERDELLDIEREVTQWIQEELDRLKLKMNARDFIEEALSKRLSWLHLRPTKPDKVGARVKLELDILNFFDVWFDTKAKDVMETDFFVRKIKKMYEIKNNPRYFDTKDLTKYDSSETDDASRKDEYTYKHSGGESRPGYTDSTIENIVVDEAELLEYYGVYDMNPKSMDSEGDENYVPDIQEVIFSLGNRTTLIRAEKNPIETEKKRLMFPIRPMRQANTLIGKSAAQLVKDIAKSLNEVESLQMDNYKLLVKLLFRYNRDSDVDLGELKAGGGNAIGYTGDKDGIDLFPIPNLIRESMAMAGGKIQTMQSTSGAVDYVQGTEGAGGITETASGIKSMTEQALFKFSMMTDNVYDDLMEFVNFVIILLYKYDETQIILKHPKLVKFFAVLSSIDDLEENYVFDIELKDISQRRDVERHQWSNAIGVIGPLVQQTGGNLSELLRQFMEVWQVPNIDKILQVESPEALAAKLMANPALLQQVLGIVAQAAKQEQAGGKGGPGVQLPPGGTMEQQVASEETAGAAGGP